MAPTFSEVTPAGLTKAEVHGLVAKVLGLDVADIEDIAIVAKVTKGDKHGYAFGGLGSPLAQGAFLADALDFLSEGLIDTLTADIAKELGIELPGNEDEETKED